MKYWTTFERFFFNMIYLIQILKLIIPPTKHLRYQSSSSQSSFLLVFCKISDHRREIWEFCSFCNYQNNAWKGKQLFLWVFQVTFEDLVNLIPWLVWTRLCLGKVKRPWVDPVYQTDDRITNGEMEYQPPYIYIWSIQKTESTKVQSTDCILQHPHGWHLTSGSVT